ncbi:MAG: hypothetical protein ACLFN7_05385 [Candidatus Acetothermia bacterium]
MLRVKRSFGFGQKLRKWDAVLLVSGENEEEGQIKEFKELRVLDLGWDLELPEKSEDLNLGVENRGFEEDVFFPDFDAVFIDPGGISSLWQDYLEPSGDGSFRTSPEEDRGLSRGLMNLMDSRTQEVKNLVRERSGFVFCKFRAPGQPLKVLDREMEEEINIYSWLPWLNLEGALAGRGARKHSGKGLEVARASSQLADFLNRQIEGAGFEALIEDLDRVSEIARVVTAPLATTPAGKVAAFKVKAGGGGIYFLPARIELEESEVKELLHIVENAAVGGSVLGPDWLEGYRLEGEEELRTDIDDYEGEIAELQEAKEEKQKKLNSMKSFKEVLSAQTSRQLKNRLERGLSWLGLDPEKGPSGIDIKLSSSEGGNFALNTGAEPKGAVGLSPYHELVRGINDLKIYENEDPQGVLIANGYAGVDPDERPKEVEEELVEGCNLYGFTLVTAREIYDAVKGLGGRDEMRSKLVELFQNG